MSARIYMVGALVVLFLAGAAMALEPQLYKGSVVSAGAGKLVMKDTAGKDQSFSVDSATKIMVNGKLARLEDLQETMLVQVTTDEKGKVLAISTIDKDKKSDKRRVLVAVAD